MSPVLDLARHISSALSVTSAGGTGVISPESPSVEVVAINLKRVERRLELVMPELFNLTLPRSFSEAHTLLVNQALSDDEPEFRQKYVEPLSRPLLGVGSSHSTGIQTFLREGESDYLFVFEVDVIFDTAFPFRKLARLCTEIGIDYMRLFATMNQPSVQISVFYDRSVIRDKNGPCGVQAYLLLKARSSKIMETLTVINSVLDVAVKLFRRTGLRICSVFPFPLIDRFPPSTRPIQEKRAASATCKFARLAARGRNKFSTILGNRILAGRDR